MKRHVLKRWIAVLIISMLMPMNVIADTESTFDIPAFEDPSFVPSAGIRQIEDGAFEGIQASSVEIPYTCESIGAYAFRNSAVTQIEIPPRCTVGENAFEGCEQVFVYTSEESPAAQYCEEHDNCFLVATEEVQLTIRYYSNQGEQLHEPDIIYGLSGDTLRIKHRQIEGYYPQANYLWKYLSDSDTNILYFIYRPADVL